MRTDTSEWTPRTIRSEIFSVDGIKCQKIKKDDLKMNKLEAAPQQKDLLFHLNCLAAAEAAPVSLCGLHAYAETLFFFCGLRISASFSSCLWHIRVLLKMNA